MLRPTLLSAGLIAVALAFPAASRAGESPYVLTIKDHVFAPAVLDVPAGQAFEIIVRNEDETPEEFESIELDREKIVSGGAEIRVRIDALRPGTYDYYGEFHMDTAFGQIVAK
jgi:plastocyanin